MRRWLPPQKHSRKRRRPAGRAEEDARHDLAMSFQKPRLAAAERQVNKRKALLQEAETRIRQQKPGQDRMRMRVECMELKQQLKAAEEILKENDELLISGGNRSSKTEFAAKYCVKRSILRCIHSDSSTGSATDSDSISDSSCERTPVSVASSAGSSVGSISPTGSASSTVSPSLDGVPSDSCSSNSLANICVKSNESIGLFKSTIPVSLLRLSVASATSSAMLLPASKVHSRLTKNRASNRHGSADHG